MKRIFTLLLVLFAGFTANAQYYYFSGSGEFSGSLNQDPTYPAGGGQVAGWTSLVGPSAATPVWSANQTLPFAFNFNGAPVTDYKISSTGVLTFTTAATAVPGATSATLPDASIPDKSICAWGLNASGTNDNGSIKVFGTAPNRQLWIHYSSCTNGTIGWSYYSIVLVEGTDQIFVVDQRNTTGAGALTIGIQIDGTNAVNVTGSPAVGAQAGTNPDPADDYHYEFIQGVQPPNEIKLQSFDLLPYVAAGNVNMVGTVRNLGSNPITQFGVSYDAGSGPVTGTVTGVNIPSNGTYQFIHSTPLTTVAGSAYSINMTVSMVGDVNMANNSLTSNAVALTSIPSRTVVGEERTGTWCGWCPRGAVGLAGMEATSDFIGIAVHNSDPMTISNYDGGIATWIPSSFPTGGVDRVTTGNPANFSVMYAGRVNDLTPCKVNSVTYTSTATNITVTADVEFMGTISGDYRLSLVTLEDDLINSDAGWAQVNYYDGGGNGLMTDPVTGFEWSTAGDPVNSVDFGGYDHVAMTLSSNDILGTPGSLPASSVPVGVHSYTFAAIPKTTYNDLSKAHAVVMIVNSVTGEIMNAGKSSSFSAQSLDELSNVANYKVYPNPSTGSVSLAFNLLNNANVSVQVTDALGNIVHTEASTLMVAGEHNAAFNGANLADGMYFVNLNVDGEVITKRLTIVK
ncbi:MAG: T9SS type A sorting domain-containing protein [Crocinitomicaceae bacterium]|nr:T9SS type A sorting domain-containing protein [Crocinitomicaceae bacterium]